MSNANEMTFGVEIECIMLSCPFRLGGYHNGIQIPGFPEGWNAQRDGSLGMGGVEIVSPVLKGIDGLKQITVVCTLLAEMGAKVDRRCGFHVHVGHDRNDAASLEKVVAIVANYEKALYAATGTKARESSHFCKSIKGDFQNLQFGRSINTLGCAAGDRYHLLNIANLVNGGKPTVEFRVFSGTISAVKIISYVRVCLALIERAQDTSKKAKWTAKTPVETSPIHRAGGVGQTEMTRLFYQLGWTKGRTKTVYGNLEAEVLPSIKESKKELMRLAAKYDAQ